MSKNIFSSPLASPALIFLSFNCICVCKDTIVLLRALISRASSPSIVPLTVSKIKKKKKKGEGEGKKKEKKKKKKREGKETEKKKKRKR